MLTPEQRHSRVVRLSLAAGLVGVLIVALTYKVFEPILFGRSAATSEDRHVEVPLYDYQSWHAQPVQAQGRTKPFESACVEVMRQVAGKSKFEGNDAVAIVLQWMMTNGTRPAGSKFVDWENYPFILCDHHDLRRVIYQHYPTFDNLDKDKDGFLSSDEADRLFDYEQFVRADLDKDGKLSRAEFDKWHDDLIHGKYISPADLRRSPGLNQLLESANQVRMKDSEKAPQLMSPEERKAEEVMERLVAFDSICQNDPASARRRQQHDDPLHFVNVDRVPESAWFSIGDLRMLQKDDKDKDRWLGLMRLRMGEAPQCYLSPDRLQDLRQFQDRVKAGQGRQAVEELAGALEQRDRDRVQDFSRRYKDKDTISISELQTDAVLQGMQREAFEHLRGWVTQQHQLAANLPINQLVPQITQALADGRERVLGDLRQRVTAASKEGYHPDDQKWRMLHIGYLETRYPNVYRESATWQVYPAADVDRVLTSYDRARQAYVSGSADQFNEASQQFFQTLKATTDLALCDGLAKLHPSQALAARHAAVEQAAKSNDLGQMDAANEAFFSTAKQENLDFRRYPGERTLDLEMAFNRIQPFLWAWIIMLLAQAAFVASYALDSRVCYWLGFAFYLSSLAFQIFGFYCRISISGRAPVTNMYETVIFVSAMSAVFALILETIYRKKVIALAGALVATVGLVLADQLPVALDPKISPLVPVLRSNFWLTIHVLTIVSSYAGGTLAWGLGNLSLALLAFGQPRRELLKSLSNFTYRAMQIAVLLLAAGTFLGGWWAAYSWGRFWGWDPKEVWALISLVVYVIPLHARYIGWVKDFGLAVAAVLCYAAIVMSWYGVNFVLAAGLHSYGFGGGGPWWIFWAGLVNIEWVIAASLIYTIKSNRPAVEGAPDVSPTVETAPEGEEVAAS